MAFQQDSRGDSKVCAKKNIARVMCHKGDSAQCYYRGDDQVDARKTWIDEKEGETDRNDGLRMAGGEGVPSDLETHGRKPEEIFSK